MSRDSEKIDEIFQIHENEISASVKSETFSKVHLKTGVLKEEEKEWADEDAAEEQEVPQDRYHPIQQREEIGTGCLGGILFAVFVMCVSIVLACLAWMAASDMLALNKESFTATIVLPESIFKSEIVEVKDENGNVTGQKSVSHADIEYLSSALKQAGLIEYRWLFEFYCNIASADTKVRPGEYQLQSSYDYRALIQNLRPNAGSAVTVNVTLIEGMTMREMFVLLERSGVSSYEDLMTAAADYNFNYSFLAEPGEEGAQRLEGYLFPETYNFYANMQASSTINKFLDEFNSHMSDEILQQLETAGVNLRDVVTVASMIEKEAADDEERADIASVIYNRLNANMVLGIDATILYVHPEHEGAPTAEMLAEDSPYNTRRSAGLPPTPICNPGLASLQAAMQPSMTDYYYYALDTETGRHRFFSNQEEFDAFVATQNYS